MNAGDLNRGIRIEQQVQAQEPTTGDVTLSWQKFLPADPDTQFPAAIAPKSGREVIAAQATQAEGDTYISFWWQPGITTAMRAVDDQGVMYNIVAVIPDNVNGYTSIMLLCQSGLTDGR